MTPLKDLPEGSKFKYPRPTALTGVYVKGPIAEAYDPNFFYVHEDGIPNDKFVSSQGLEVIPI